MPVRWRGGATDRPESQAFSPDANQRGPASSHATHTSRSVMSQPDTQARASSGSATGGINGTAAARLAVRHGTVMPPSLLESQFADLEEPTSDEPAIRVDVRPAPNVIAQRIVKELGLSA